LEAVSSAERLYEQCSALLALNARLLTMVAQVYGGSMSFVVGANLWSNGPRFDSSCSAGDTVVSGLSMVFDNNRISGSQAVTMTIGGVLQAPNPTFHKHAHTHA